MQANTNKKTSSPTYMREESKFTGGYSREMFLAAWWAYRPWALRLIITLLIGVMGRALLLGNANVLGMWIDSFCKTNCKPTPHYLSGFSSVDYAKLLFTMALVGFIFNTAFRISVSRIGTHAVSRFYDAVSNNTAKFPMSFFDTTPIGRIITRFSSDYSAIFRMAGGPMGEFLCLFFDLLLMMVLSFVASAWFVPIIALSFIANYLIYQQNIKKIRQARRGVSRARSPAIAHFSETVQGNKVIKAYGREQVFLDRFLFFVDDFANQKLKNMLTFAWFSLQLTFTMGVILLITTMGGYTLIKNNIVTVGALGVAITFIMASSVTMQLFFDWLSSLEEALTGLERMHEYLKHGIEPHNNSLTIPTNITPRLEVKNLTLQYRHDLPIILNNISFIVDPGEHIGIIGSTGSGKSSIIQSIFYLYPFASGSISIGGYSPLEPVDSKMHLSLDNFRELISLIPQDPVLFIGNLRQNIDPWNKHTDEQLLKYLQQIGLNSLLEKLGNNPLRHKIEERGANLSVGERQLICMARCFLQDVPIVIFDEATSSIDPNTEAMLVETTNKCFTNKTRITIAHRLSTVTKCDKIIWIKQGQIFMHDTASVVLQAFTQHQA